MPRTEKTNKYRKKKKLFRNASETPMKWWTQKLDTKYIPHQDTRPWPLPWVCLGRPGTWEFSASPPQVTINGQLVLKCPNLFKEGFGLEFSTSPNPES
jgi:hypothetical protein